MELSLDFAPTPTERGKLFQGIENLKKILGSSILAQGTRDKLARVIRGVSEVSNKSLDDLPPSLVYRLDAVARAFTWIGRPNACNPANRDMFDADMKRSFLVGLNAILSKRCLNIEPNAPLHVDVTTF